MRLVCPACGAIASLEAWANDAGGRVVLAEIAALPGMIVRHVPDYLGLFRVRGSKKGLSWAKTLRLVQEVKALVADGFVAHSGLPARPCAASVWADAMGRMVDRPPQDLPLDNHRYLVKVAYGLADAADREAESLRIADERAGRMVRDTTRLGRDEKHEPEPLDPGWMREQVERAKKRKKPHREDGAL